MKTGFMANWEDVVRYVIAARSTTAYVVRFRGLQFSFSGIEQ